MQLGIAAGAGSAGDHGNAGCGCTEHGRANHHDSASYAFGDEPAHRRKESMCFVPIRKGGYYEAGTISTEQLTAPSSRCTTISVSDVRDPDSRAATDTCGFFKVGFWSPVTGNVTYLEPVIACSSYRTVLAGNVPNNARYVVTYDVEHFDPAASSMSHLTFRIWH